jgi:hypothetical protein
VALCVAVLVLILALLAVHVLAEGGRAGAGSLDGTSAQAAGVEPVATPTPNTWEPPTIGKIGSATQLPLGAPIRFTLTVYSSGWPNEGIWTDVVVVDVVDSAFRIDAVTVPPSVIYTPQGNVVTLAKTSLVPGESFVATIDCTLVGPAQPGNVLANQATLAYDDAYGVPQPAIPSEIVQITVSPYSLFLPLIMRGGPPSLPAPVLSAISNPSGLGTYDVVWSAVAGAVGYDLEQALRSDFSGATTVYAGPNTTYSASGQQPTRYYYRAKAYNAYAQSLWSNIRQTDVRWELEPNDNGWTQANGPLVSGLTYYGQFPPASNPRDYFFIDLPAAHTVQIWLTNIPSGNNFDLVLRRDDANLTEIARSDTLGNADEYIEWDLQPARYKIQVWHASGPGNATQAYHLRVVYQ